LNIGVLKGAIREGAKGLKPLSWPVKVKKEDKISNSFDLFVFY